MARMPTRVASKLLQLLMAAKSQPRLTKADHLTLMAPQILMAAL